MAIRYGFAGPMGSDAGAAQRLADVAIDDLLVVFFPLLVIFFNVVVVVVVVAVVVVTAAVVVLFPLNLRRWPLKVAHFF